MYEYFKKGKFQVFEKAIKLKKKQDHKLVLIWKIVHCVRESLHGMSVLIDIKSQSYKTMVAIIMSQEQVTRFIFVDWYKRLRQINTDEF